MKKLILSVILLASAFPCFARLFPYIDSLEEADAVALITVTSYEQSLHDGLIYEKATLTVDTAISGTKVGDKIDVSFGVPSAPDSSTSLSDAPSFKIAEKYIVLFVMQEGRLAVARASLILGDRVRDGYFEDFAGFHDVPVSKAIDLLKTKKKAIPPNQALQHNDPSCHVSCLKPLADKARQLPISTRIDTHAVSAGYRLFVYNQSRTPLRLTITITAGGRAKNLSRVVDGGSSFIIPGLAPSDSVSMISDGFDATTVPIK